MSKQGTGTELTYCPHCEQERETVDTVPWQDDLCGACQNPIPEEP